MKKKYCWYSRIAICISIIVGVALTKNAHATFNMRTFLCLSLSCMHLSFWIINYKKDKDINKLLGFIKVSGDRWLGNDGFWHDGYKEICPKKIERYFDKGGEDWGYLSSFRASSFLALLGVILPLMVLTGDIAISFAQEGIFEIIFYLVITIYLVIRRAILG